jgi:hypothetical protein
MSKVSQRDSKIFVQDQVMEGVQQTKVKYNHSGHTLKHPFEHLLKY